MTPLTTPRTHARGTDQPADSVNSVSVNVGNKDCSRGESMPARRAEKQDQAVKTSGSRDNDPVAQRAPCYSFRHKAARLEAGMKRYAKLARTISESIRRGDLAPVRASPPCAPHAAPMAWPSTVFRAYYALEGEGLIVARARSGYFVANLDDKRVRFGHEPPRKPAARPRATAIRCSGCSTRSDAKTSSRSAPPSPAIRCSR